MLVHEFSPPIRVAIFSGYFIVNYIFGFRPKMVGLFSFYFSAEKVQPLFGRLQILATIGSTIWI